ncbi:MAG: hypothetical protein ABSG54_18710 [Terriglobia bacterium]|jgi:hypothetical protein
MPYHVSARAYLERARTQLDAATPEGLFYAAFELRAGIQARMQQYLQAQDSIAQRKKNDWKLGKLERTLEDVFQISDRIAEVAVYDPQAGEFIATLYYTPVTSELRRDGGRLGELLHAMQQFRPDDDAWWQNTRDFLEKVCGQLATACAGTLLAPLLREPGSDKVVMRAEMFEESHREVFQKLHAGFEVFVRVQYLDDLPRVH